MDIEGFEQAEFHELPSTFSHPYPAFNPASGNFDMMGPPESTDEAAHGTTSAAGTPVPSHAPSLAGLSQPSGPSAPTGMHLGSGGGAGHGYGSDLFGDAERYARLCVALALHEEFDVIHSHDWLTYPAGAAVAKVTGKSHDELNRDALELKPGESGLLALDWNNGNRTILVDPLLTGLIVGLTLHSKPAEVYRAFVEATAFGALRIIDRMEEYGVSVERVVACGGIADKSALTMQIYADVFNRPVNVAKSEQTCALGSAIFAAVAAGAYPDTLAAQEKMAGLKDITYVPKPENVKIYQEIYTLYRQLHDGFGVRQSNVDLFPVMKRLIEIRSEG
jgi:hypothetical protein